MCQQSVDELVLISDQEMRNAMALLFYEMKLVVEPAGAAATAGLLGPLRDRLQGKRVAVVVWGLKYRSGYFFRALGQGKALRLKGRRRIKVMWVVPSE